MAKTPSTKTNVKTKKTPATTPKPEAAKAETSKAETPVSTSDTDSGTGAGSKTPSAPARPISYFSSVSSDEYRSGWDSIFGSGGKKSARKPVKSAAAKRPNKLPATITVDADDLDPATREQLKAVFRQQAKKKRLNYDKLSGNGQIRWQIACHISNR
jgi:hypothetical protein